MKSIKNLVGIILALSFAAVSGSCAKALTPTIKEGRFNFSVTYEVVGSQKTISSIYVCEFVKVVKALDGSYIEWNSYIEDTELSNRLNENRGYLPLKTCEDGVIYRDFCLSAKYFMSDPSFGNTNANKGATMSSIAPRVFIEYNEAKGEELGVWYSEDRAILENYGVKIISYEYDAPIENIYK